MNNSFAGIEQGRGRQHTTQPQQQPLLPAGRGFNVDLRQADGSGSGNAKLQQERDVIMPLMLPGTSERILHGAMGRDRAYTRYRPIAPKPLTLKPGESAGSTASDPPSSSTLSFERSTASSSGSRGGKKRSRKRSGAEPQLPPVPPPAPAPAAHPPPQLGSVRGPPVMLPGMQMSQTMMIPPDSLPVLPISSAEEVSGSLPLSTTGFGAYRPTKEDRAAPITMSETWAAAESEHLFNVGQGIGVGVGTGTGPGQRFDRKRYGYGFGALKVADNTSIPGTEWLLRPNNSIADARTSQQYPNTTSNSIGGESGPASFVSNCDAAAAASIPSPYFPSQKDLQGLQRTLSDGLEVVGLGTGAGASHTVGFTGIMPGRPIDPPPPPLPGPPSILHSGISFPGVAHSAMGPPQSQLGRENVHASSEVTQSSRMVEVASCSPATVGSGTPPTPSRSVVVDREAFSSCSSHSYNTNNNSNNYTANSNSSYRGGVELVTLSLLPDIPSLQQRVSPKPLRPPSSSPSHENAPFLSLGVGGLDLTLWEGDGRGREDQAKPLKVVKTVDSPDESRNQRLFSKNQEQENKEFYGRILQLRDAGSKEQHEQLKSASVERAAADIGKALHGVSSLDRVAMKPKFWPGEESSKSATAAPIVADNAYMEENYSTGEPMMLANAETRAPLWENQAYKKEFAKRDPGGVWPQLDPLGCPTRLASFLYQPPVGPIVNAILWIFLTTIRSCENPVANLLGAAAEAGDEGDGGEISNPKSDTVQGSQKKSSVKSAEDFSGALQGSQAKLSGIAGQLQGSAQPPGSAWRRR